MTVPGWRNVKKMLRSNSMAFGNTFRGQLLDSGVRVEFSGEIVENNHIEGIFSGGFGERKVNGLWTMKLSRKEQGKPAGS